MLCGMVVPKPLDRVWQRVSRKRSIWGWIVFVLGGGWASFSAWSTGDFALSKLLLLKPTVVAIWAGLSSVKPYWYQAGLMIAGLAWIAFVASRPEKPMRIVGDKQQITPQLAQTSQRPAPTVVTPARPTVPPLQPGSPASEGKTSPTTPEQDFYEGFPLARVYEDSPLMAMTRPKPHVCKKCGREYRAKVDLLTLTGLASGPGGGRKVKCPYCGNIDSWTS